MWLVTFVTHNSRVSQRMREFRVARGKPIVLSPHDQVRVAEAILDAADRFQIGVMAINVLPDHVHAIVSADSEKILAENVRKLKGLSAHEFRKTRPDATGSRLWAQKFNRRPLLNESALAGAMHYVLNNHLKHAQQWGEGLVHTWQQYLRPLVERRCVPIERVLEGPLATG